MDDIYKDEEFEALKASKAKGELMYKMGGKYTIDRLIATVDSLNEYRYYSRHILAVLHRDGGHYHQEHGTEKATKDAIKNYYKRISELEERNAKLYADKVDLLDTNVDLDEQISMLTEELSRLKNES